MDGKAIKLYTEYDPRYSASVDALGPPACEAVLHPERGELDSLVHDLRQLYGGVGVRLAVQMGRLIIERLFRGDLTLWRARGRKDVSFRKLEAHPDLPFRASTLSRAVAIYMLSQRRADLLAFRHLGPSHLHEIACLGEKEQDRLLERAEMERWSIRKLRQEVGRVATTGDSRRERAPGFAKWLRRARTDVSARVLTSELDHVARLELDESRELLETTRDLLHQLELLAKALTSRVQEVDRQRRISSLVHRTVPAPERSSRSSQARRTGN